MITNTPPTLRSLLLIGSAALALAGTSGCIVVAAGAAGAGTYAYVSGELDVPLGSPYDHVVRASEISVDKLLFAKVSEKKDALTCVIVARTSEDQKVVVTVSKDSDTSSTVKIRIGLLGDERKSKALLEKLEAEL
jgi:hypothetical protein